MRTPIRRNLFYHRRQQNIYVILALIIAILLMMTFMRSAQAGEIQRIFEPTATPTRTGNSYASEGDAFFVAGDLNASILAYQQSVVVEPNNAENWAKLARIQTYSSALLTTDQARFQRLQDALESINRAVELDPNSSNIRAIRAFVLDWNANPVLYGEKSVALLNEAEQEAVRAIQLDNTNTLALAFYAEILVDQQKWSQAEQYIRQASERGESLMDVHRIYAYVLESLGQYRQAIEEYDKAIAITPNLTFLHLRAGANYRRLALGTNNTFLYEKSLEYFAKAARINEQLGVQDPIPYLAISRTYSQQGEFFIAARNVQRALSFSPNDPDIYGQLGIIYFKSRNYEGAIPALQCAIRGCSAEESCDGRGGCGRNEVGVAVNGLPLSPNTVVYYYTYGSVLSALSRPQQNYCPEAMEVFAEVRAQFSGDPTIMSIVQSGEAICRSGLLSSAPSEPTSTPQAEPTQAP
jgi:tetratricopeptide (TPR) repeat protein